MSLRVLLSLTNVYVYVALLLVNNFEVGALGNIIIFCLLLCLLYHVNLKILLTLLALIRILRRIALPT